MDHVKLNIPDNLFNKSLSELIDQAYLTACENIDKHPAFADIKVLLGQAMKFVDNKNTFRKRKVYLVSTGNLIVGLYFNRQGAEKVKEMMEEDFKDPMVIHEFIIHDNGEKVPEGNCAIGNPSWQFGGMDFAGRAIGYEDLVRVNALKDETLPSVTEETLAVGMMPLVNEK